MRVVVVVNEHGSPELYRALLDTPARLRAERLRTLATVGLVSFSGRGSTSEPAKQQQGQSAPTGLSGLAKKLEGSL